MRVNARLVSERNKIPYLASTVLPEGVDEKILDDFHDPSPGDVEKYGQLANILANKLDQQSTVIEILDDPSPPPPTMYSSRSHKKLPTPTPTPTPALSISYPQVPTTQTQYSLPIPSYAAKIPIPVNSFPPPGYSIQPNISYPPPVSYTQPLFPGANPYPPIGMNPFIPPPLMVTPVNSLIAPIQIQQPKTRSLWSEIISDEPAPVPASKLSREFFVEKQMALSASPQAPSNDQDQTSLAAEFKKQEERKLLLAQEEAQRKLAEERRTINASLKCRWTSNSEHKSPRRNQTPVLDEDPASEIEVIDQAIANLDKEIQLKRDGQSSNVELDRFGYVIRSSTEKQPPQGHNPADYYKSLFGGDQPNFTRRRRRSNKSRSKSPSKRRRSRSRGRKSRSRSRERKSGSRSRGRNSRETRSRSKSRRRSRSPIRSRTRYSISPVRPRARSPVRAREKSPRRRLTRSRSRSATRRNLRKSRSRSRSKGKLRMDTEPKKKGQVYAGPPVPAFMLHPADRLFSGDAERGSSVRKRMHQRKEKGYDDVDNGMAALDVTLDLIKDMKAEVGEASKEVSLISMEVEILDDGTFKQFTQIGVSTEDKETGVFNRSLFRAILPTYMTQYDTNLILKNQNNLHSSLKFKFDEDQKTYSFQHVKKGDDKLVSEQKALTDLIGFIKSIKDGGDVFVFTLSKGLFLPLLLARLKHYKLDEEFCSLVEGFCDFTSCITNLKLNGIWKETKFGDLIDVYKHIMGKTWPKEPRHCDGISILSGSVLKKMVRDYTEYLNDLSLNFSMIKFLKVCGLRTVSEMMSSFKDEIEDTNCRTDLDRNDVKELELRPSDRPGEITIVTLKRFECFEVLDMDEVEEEGINEDDYFANEGNKAYVTSKTVIKPGFVVSVSMKLHALSLTDPNKKKRDWTLVSKNSAFGESLDKTEANEEGECEENLKRIKQASKCEISRQIVKITRTFKPVKDDMSKCDEINVIQVKVLNPLDFDMVLDVGDELAVVKLEKKVDIDNPDTKSYSEIKLEAEMRLAKEEDDRVREEDDRAREIEKELENSKKKRKRPRKKGRKKDKKQKSQETLNKSFDHDALDFEPIDSGEDIESSEDEMDFQNPQDKESVSPLSSPVERSAEKEGNTERYRNSSGQSSRRKDEAAEKTDRNLKKKSKQSTLSRKERERRNSQSRREKAKTKEGDENEENGNGKVLKQMDSEFYTRKFYVQTAAEFTEIKAGKTVTIPMVVVADFGYSSKDLAGRKCRISINSEFLELEKNQRHADQHYKFNNYNLFEKETNLELKREPKVTWYSPMVDVEIQNFTTKTNQYPKGVRLGICRFIDENGPTAQANDGNFYTQWFKCYPPSLCSVRGMTTASVTMILQEGYGYTIEDMVNQKCRIKKYGSQLSQNHLLVDREILNSCCIKEQEASVIRYTDPMTKKVYPAIIVELKNITPQKKTFKRDLPLALGKFISPSKNVESVMDAFETILPDPVPVRLEPLPPGEEDTSHYSQGPVRYESTSLGLPEPVPGNKRLLHNIENVTQKSPSEKELKGWSVKKLKSCLGDAGLHQYGLKNDLVKRLFHFYQKNPSKSPVKPLTSREVAMGLVNELVNKVLGVEPEDPAPSLTEHDLPVPVSSRIKKVQEGSRIPVVVKQGTTHVISQATNQDTRLSELDDGLGGRVSIMARNGVYIKNGQEIPVLGGSSAFPLESRSPALSSGTASPFGSEGSLTIPVIGSSEQSKKAVEKQKIIEVDKERIMKKIGEIKSFEKQGLEFFKSGMSILCSEDFSVGPMERKIVTFKMPELDMFSSELAGRKILIKERDNDKRILTIFKQTANVIVNERKSEVDVLVQNERNKECTVKASDKVKFIRVYVEKLEKDLDHQFDIPEDDDIISEMEVLLEAEPVDAVTSEDIILQPKTYHSEVCTVKILKSYTEKPFAVLERTKASGMKIGMRKMILVPKVLSFLNTDTEVATIIVNMYNASKQTLRITKKTKIASVRIQKPGILLDDDYELSLDQRKKYGEVEGASMSMENEGKPIMLTFTENGSRKPSLVRMVARSGKIFVPLGAELAGKFLQMVSNIIY
eukprot:TRINITY_DN10736_c0_g1_i4.p1 TRINITY_DN10736_c0_g1~~TRINITY_DN10736_c0_g1_i4.p1  ORF type:complete len:2067 (+),score=620.98 TRINITY_DN10736_c0_g1_i4:267-6467(+)